MNISQRQGVLLSNGLSKQQKRSDRAAAEVLPQSTGIASEMRSSSFLRASCLWHDLFPGFSSDGKL
jgi:hypothetical protein